MVKNCLVKACVIMTFLVGCTQADYTRGIGVYPGNPEDYTGPEIVRCCGDYRNLAAGSVTNP